MRADISNRVKLAVHIEQGNWLAIYLDDNSPARLDLAGFNDLLIRTFRLYCIFTH